MLDYPTYSAPGEEDWTWYQHLAYGVPGVGPSVQYLDTGHRGSFVPLDYTSWLTTYFWATAPLVVMALSGMSAFEIGGSLHKTGHILRFAGSPAGVVTALAAAGSIAQHEIRSEHGAGVSHTMEGGGEFGVAPSYHLEGGKPWWE